MKNLCLLLLTACIILSGCKKSDTSTQNHLLVGTWIATLKITNDTEWVLEHVFRTDGSVLIRSFERTISTKQVTGHRARIEGTYRLKDNNLLIADKARRTSDLPVPEDQLKEVPPNATADVSNIAFENNMTAFVKYFNCGPAALCVGPNYFIKQ
jgi:hypothetical protein